MFSDGYAHSLEWFSDTYKEIQVGREDFPAEKEKGLYWFTGDLRIPEGTEQIVFTYRNPEGALIQRENVFVVRDGEQGDPAPQYLGMFANPPAAREDNTPLQKGDTYLNKTDRKLYRYDGLDWIAVPDEDPGWWEALGDAVKEAAESGVQITAANAWVEKLIAGTVLAQKLFAKEITIPSGGVIQSQNFSEGTQGFRILGNGKIEIVDGYIKSNDFSTDSTKNSGWSVGYPQEDSFYADTLNINNIYSRKPGQGVFISGLNTNQIVTSGLAFPGMGYYQLSADGFITFVKQKYDNIRLSIGVSGHMPCIGRFSYNSRNGLYDPVHVIFHYVTYTSQDTVIMYGIALSEGDYGLSSTNITYYTLQRDGNLASPDIGRYVYVEGNLQIFI